MATTAGTAARAPVDAESAPDADAAPASRSAGVAAVPLVGLLVLYAACATALIALTRHLLALI